MLSAIFCLASDIIGQNVNLDSLTYTQAIAFYNGVVGDGSSLYTGRHYSGYDFGIEGHQYFDTNQAISGSLLYDENLYDNVAMYYELVKDELLITSPDNDFQIIVKKQDIEWFDLKGHRFVFLETSGLSGIYELLSMGVLDVLIKRTKILKKEVGDRSVKREFVQHNAFYIRNGDEVYVVTSKKDLLNYDKERKKEIRKMLNKNKFNFKKDPEHTIIRTVEYLGASTNK